MEDIRDILGPDYRQALDREELIRSAAFLGVTELIGGVEVMPLTLEHLCRLQCVGSPFVSGGTPLPQDVVLFLWAVSPDYDPKSRWRRYWFCRSVRKLNYAKAVEAINEYLNEAFEDAPAEQSLGFTAPYWSSYASIVALLAGEFGWTERAITQMPLKRIWQYVRIAKKRLNPQETFTNKHSERVRRLCLDRINSR